MKGRQGRSRIELNPVNPKRAHLAATTAFPTASNGACNSPDLEAATDTISQIQRPKLITPAAMTPPAAALMRFPRAAAPPTPPPTAASALPPPPRWRPVWR